MFIDNKVYDVTNFKHPGGKPHLLQNAGQDASQAFEDIGHAPDKVGPWLEKLYIGEYKNPDGDIGSKKTTYAEESSTLKFVLYAITFALIYFFLNHFGF